MIGKKARILFSLIVGSLLDKEGKLMGQLQKETCLPSLYIIAVIQSWRNAVSSTDILMLFDKRRNKRVPL